MSRRRIPARRAFTILETLVASAVFLCALTVALSAVGFFSGGAARLNARMHAHLALQGAIGATVSMLAEGSDLLDPAPVGEAKELRYVDRAGDVVVARMDPARDELVFSGAGGERRRVRGVRSASFTAVSPGMVLVRVALSRDAAPGDPDAFFLVRLANSGAPLP